MSERYVVYGANVHCDGDIVPTAMARDAETAQRIAAALNQQAGAVEALEKLSITLDLVDKYDLSKNVPWPVAELVREARAALAAVKPAALVKEKDRG